MNYKLDEQYYGKTYYGKKVIKLSADTSQKDLKHIMKESNNNFKGITVTEKKKESE